MPTALAQNQARTIQRNSGSERQQELEQYYGRWLINNITALCQKDGRAFEYTHPSIRLAIAKIATWLAVDRYTRPWLLLQGGTGTGKTTITKALVSILMYDNSNVGVFNITSHTAREIAELCLTGGEAYNNATYYEIMQKFKCVAIDDIGTESAEVVNYGNISRPITDLFEHRYENRDVDRATIIASTNLDDKTLLKRYGARFISRMASTAVRVEFSNPDFRTRKVQ